jgi:midasin
LVFSFSYKVYAALLSQKLHILNCHQHTETADFLGGLRPVRGKEHLRAKLLHLLSAFFEQARGELGDALSFLDDEPNLTGKNLSQLMPLFDHTYQVITVSTGASPSLQAVVDRVKQLNGQYSALFTWFVFSHLPLFS